MVVLGLRKCCFCVNHLIGVQIIAYIGLILNGLAIIVAAIRPFSPQLVLQLVSTSSFALLFVGTYRRVATPVLLWVIAYGLTVTAQTSLACVDAALGAGRHLLTWLPYVIAYPINIYFVLVALALYQRMGNPLDDLV